MFSLSNLATLDEAEYEPIGLFDQMSLNLAKLREEVFELYDGKKFECDSDTFYELVYHIGLTQQQLENPEIINEDFFMSIGEMLLMIQADFEKLVNHKGIMQDALKAIRDKGSSIIDGTEIVRLIPQEDISQIRRSIFRLTTDLKEAKRNPQMLPTQQNAQVLQLRVTQSGQTHEGSSGEISENMGTAEQDNIIDFAARKRAQTIQNLIFDQSGKLLPDAIVKKKRQRIKETLTRDMVPTFNEDCFAANDEIFPDHELDDRTILRAIKQATIRKDGAFIQSIKNNLVKNAANDDTYDMGLETSTLLADHIKNLTSTNFIALQTIEYGKLTILESKTVEYGDATYYKIQTQSENGDKKTFLMSANAAAVGDLSDKIIGEYDSRDKLHIGNKPCTIRHIRSRIVSKEVHKKGFLSTLGSNINTGFQKLRNRFGWGKK